MVILRRIAINSVYGWAISTLLLTVLLGQAAHANVLVPDAGNVPFYARLAGATNTLPPEIYHTADLALILFYRPPACVPTDFKLLEFFDFAAFDCAPPTTDGISVWRNGPATDLAPIQVNLHGLGAVPVWIVSWPELEAAVADNVLTIDDLAALPSLIGGAATSYHEELHPTEAANVGKIRFNGRGILEDGRAFKFWGQQNDVVNGGNTQLRIELR
jgi:hypothetical protein